MHEAQPAGQPSAAHTLASPATATALGVLALTLLGTTAALSVLTHQATFLNVATGIPIPLVYATVGVIVARHQPRNPVGWILILFVVLFLIPALAGKVGHDIGVSSSGDVTYSYHLVPVLGALNAVAYLSIGVTWLSFVGHQVLSWRRASGESRQQLKWLACGATITLCVGLLGSALSSAVAASRLLEVGVTAMPIAIGVGILKYRLYDIDRIISRTLAYAIVTGLLVGVYAGLVLLGPGTRSRLGLVSEPR